MSIHKLVNTYVCIYKNLYWMYWLIQMYTWVYMLTFCHCYGKNWWWTLPDFGCTLMPDYPKITAQWVQLFSRPENGWCENNMWGFLWFAKQFWKISLFMLIYQYKYMYIYVYININMHMYIYIYICL